MNKKIIWAIVVIIVVVFGFRLAGRLSGGKEAKTERVVPVVAISPKLGPIEQRLTLNGDIKAETEVSVRPRTTGRVEELYVKEGDYVSKGSKLLSYVAGIDPTNDLYNDLVVTSPISGVVGMQLVKIGDQVTSQVGGGISPVFVVYGIDRVKIYADVPEKYYTSITKGTRADIALDALPNELFRGVVGNIRPVIDPLSRTTQIEIILANYSHRIKPGMFAKVDLVLKRVVNATVIPFDAVLGENEKYVYLAKEGVAEKRPIVLGLENGNDVQVVSGLSPLDKVIILGQRVVREGSRIEEVRQ
ncbi:MAG: efflux RND transporter periplasmic adaptor subunit [Candidatus Margulisbacteria bacterium]|nr:efflux RND transporter periplasmic adaptor subunit [Candidatus Margulisiibacteriota bacterium]MBU1616320.1 efflux RND transporter periplasmic adaptor subunit [Candidatus Margulisiibacteriota bacterium]